MTPLSHVLLITAVVLGVGGIFLGGATRWVLLGVALVLFAVEAVIRRRRLEPDPPSAPGRRR